MTQTTGDDAEHCHIMQLPCNWQIREAAILAPHAMHAADSAGRVSTAALISECPTHKARLLKFDSD